MIQGRRRLIRVGGSVGITIPYRFLKQSQLRLGDQLIITFNDMMFAIKPTFPREREVKETGEGTQKVNCESTNQKAK